MGRYLRLLSVLVLGGFVVFILTAGEHTAGGEKSNTDQVILHGFDMNKAINTSDSFYRISSEKAVLNRKTNKTKLQEYEFFYKKPESEFYAEGDVADVLNDRTIISEGKIKGRINGISFVTGPQGRLEYDMREGVGTLSGGVVYTEKNNIIRAESSEINEASSVIKFLGNVQVEYEN